MSRYLVRGPGPTWLHDRREPGLIEKVETRGGRGKVEAPKLVVRREKAVFLDGFAQKILHTSND